MIRKGFVFLIVALVCLSFAAFQLAAVKPTVCSHIDRLITVDISRVDRGRVAAAHQMYYRQHPDELVRYQARARIAINDLRDARC